MTAIKPLMKSLLLAAALSSPGWAAAQGSSPAPAPAPISQAKKDLIQRLLTVQQPGLDGLAQQITTRPAVEISGRAQQYLINAVPVDKREATAKQIDTQLKKYVDETVPVVREAATRAAPGVYASVLEDKFTEDELKQLVVFFESPVRKKWEQLSPELTSALVKKIVDDVKDKVDPKLQAAGAATQKILEGVATKPLGGEGKPAAASKPAAKKPAAQ